MASKVEITSIRGSSAVEFMTNLSAALTSAMDGWTQIKEVTLDSEAPSVIVTWNDGTIETDLEFIKFTISSNKLVVTVKTKWSTSTAATYWTRTCGTANRYFTKAITVNDSGCKSITLQIEEYMPSVTIALGGDNKNVPIAVLLDALDSSVSDGAKKVFVIDPYSETANFTSTSAPKPFYQLYMCVGSATSKAGLCPVTAIGSGNYTTFVDFAAYSNDVTVGKKYVNGVEGFSTGIWFCHGEK